MKNILLLLFAFCFAVLFVSCGGAAERPSSPGPVVPSDNNWPVTVENLTIANKPKRVVSLSPALTETIYSLALSESMIGRSDFCDYPAQVLELESVGTAQMMDIQKLLALQPDYVLTQIELSALDMQKLQEMGAQVLLIPRASTIEGMLNIYKDLFIFFRGLNQGVSDGENYCENFSQQLNQIFDSVPDLPQYSAIYIVGLNIFDTAATPDTLEGQLMAGLGLKNIAENGKNWHYGFANLEKDNPELIIASNSISFEGLRENAYFADIDAVRQSRIFFVNKVSFERQSPRLLLDLRALKEMIYA
ncbi:MAG: helical backbone metal receptor [Oscillospiraceae bacterium]|jgi:iron complex transport system substrate-binding protein|nr:helical backbone metal receptor [Oscillospiraceae bacterium]